MRKKLQFFLSSSWIFSQEGRVDFSFSASHEKTEADF